jgi:Zn-dependent protease with chaperone function
VLIALMLALATALALARPARALPPGSTQRELELGEEAAEDIAQSVEFLEDEEITAKLQAMLDEIGRRTPRPDIAYHPFIVASPIINAFVIPGGSVYVTTGLLDAVESDDELAGVLAHEIAHNVNQHAIKRMREAPKGLGLLRLASIAALILGGGPEAAILADTAANMITAAVLNGSSVEVEMEADAHGLSYLIGSPYNPVGSLTFMEKLGSSSGKFIEEEMGIYRTHPLTRDRVRSLRLLLEENEIPILRRLVTSAPDPVARETARDGAPVTEVLFREERLLLLAGHDDARTKRALDTFTWALDHELAESDIHLVPAAGGIVVKPGAGPTCVLTAADGAANGLADLQLAGRLRTRLAELAQAERRRFQTNAFLH